jgi:hypothetical protein
MPLLNKYCKQGHRIMNNERFEQIREKIKASKKLEETVQERKGLIFESVDDLIEHITRKD